MRATALAVCVAACGGHSGDRCDRAVEHVFEMDVGPPPPADEAKMIEAVKAMARSACRAEGLSQAQADCIVAAHMPDWDDQLRACPAFASGKLPSWVIVRRPRAERGAPPDGPRESKLHYRQLVAQPRSMCGLTDAGAIQCWGRRLAVAPPSGTFVQIGVSPEMICGRAASGIVTCSIDQNQYQSHPPDVAFSDFAIDTVAGCGVRISDQQIQCWGGIYGDPLASPLAQFTSVIVSYAGACGVTVAGGVQCFGEAPPAPPPIGMLAWSRDAGTCTVDRSHHLACTGTARMGATPTGEFDTVAISRGHGCATRTGGGTVCWGENDDGACNVPQQ